MEHFRLTPELLNRNGVLTSMVQAAVIRDVASGIVPQRQNIQGRVPRRNQTGTTAATGRPNPDGAG